ncbi:MAG TPA: hypothetical protein VJ508_19405, partial [Saprospiraceae bacterium]|nr:hypothetical protein [Saprospiraceae bacterium]
PTTVSGTFTYRARVIDNGSGCATPVSGNITFVVRDDATVTISATFNEICVGGTTVLTAVITGGSSSQSYQWQSSSNNIDWGNIAGATGTSYLVPNTVPGTTYYRFILTDNLPDCSDPISNVLTIVIQPDATVTVTPPSSEICIGGSALLTANITGGSSSLTIQWQVNGGSWANIPGATSTTYAAPGNAVGTLLYRVMITDPGPDCSDPVSTSVSVVTKADATVSIAPSSLEVCVGGSALLTGTVTGGSSALTMQWQSSPDGSTGWANIPGAITSTYSAPTTVDGTTYYRLVITDPFSDCADPISNTATVVVKPDATVTVTPPVSNVCVGGSAPLTAVVTGGSSGYTIQWQSSANPGGPFNNIGGANGTTYNPPTTVAGTTYYRVSITDNFSGCDDPFSIPVQVVVSPDLVVSSQPINVNECVGGTNTMTVTTTGGSGTITY